MIFVAIIGIFALATIVRIALFEGPLAESVEPPKAIIDMHCHTASIGAGNSGAWVFSELRKSWKFSLYLKIFKI